MYGVEDNQILYNVQMKTTLLFLHGNSLNQKIFWPLDETTLIEKFEVDYFDFPGHGSSELIPSRENSSIDYLARLTEDFINSKALKNVILVGHSLGAHVSLRVKHEEVKENILVAAPIINDAEDIPNCYIDFDIFPLFVTNELSEKQITTLASSLVERKRVEWIKEILKETNGLFRELLGVSLANTTYKEKSLTQKRKSSVIFGDQDKLINRLTLKKICEGQGLTFREIKGGGHLPWVGFEEEFANLLIDLVGE